MVNLVASHEFKIRNESVGLIGRVGNLVPTVPHGFPVLALALIVHLDEKEVIEPEIQVPHRLRFPLLLLPGCGERGAFPAPSRKRPSPEQIEM